MLDGNIKIISNNLINKKDNEFLATSNIHSFYLENIKIKNKKEIIDKMILNYTLAIFSTYALDNASNLINAAYIKLNEKFDLERILSFEEKNTILSIIKNDYSNDKLESISWLLEDVRVYLWVLGFLKKPNFDRECDIKEINKIFFNMDYNHLLNESKIIENDEILEYYDLILKLISPTKSTNNINSLVTKEQIDALSWLIVLNNTNILVRCEKDNLNFEFEMPSYLNVDKISESSKELLALSSKDKKTRIVILDIGECNDDDFELRIEKNINAFIKAGFDIVNKYSLSSDNLKNKIHQIVINKNNLVLNSYMFLISNHIVRLDSLVSRDVNYKDYNSLINSKNSNIDLDLLFSLREINSSNSESVMNEFDYSNILPTTNSIGDIVKYIEQIYNEFVKMTSFDKSNVYDLKFYIDISSDYNEDIICKNYSEYISNVDSGYLNKINSLIINLKLNYIKDNETYDNYFSISFEPYNIKFVRESNHKEKNMNEIEDSINTLLRKLPISNSIFYTK